MSWLAAIEQTALSVWVRESPSLLAFPFILFLHTLGLAMVAGLSVGIDVWLLTARTPITRPLLANLHRVMWAGFGINALSGLVLLAGYPAKALTNWVFYAKLLLVAVAMWLVERIRLATTAPATQLGTDVDLTVRRLAVWSLVVWAGAIFAGRLLAYTHNILLASEGF